MAFKAGDHDSFPFSELTNMASIELRPLLGLNHRTNPATDFQEEISESLVLSNAFLSCAAKPTESSDLTRHTRTVDPKGDICLINRLILECHAALRACFLNHWKKSQGVAWSDTKNMGHDFWNREEAAIALKPKKLQWRPMGFTIALIKTGDTRTWDMTAFGYMLLKSSVCPLPKSCQDHDDIDFLLNTRNMCAHLKPIEEETIARLLPDAAVTASRLCSKYDPDKNKDLEAIIHSREHKQWINEGDLTIGEKIGDGAHGQVFRGQLRRENRIENVAIKIQRLGNDHCMERFMSEMRALSAASTRCQRSCRIYGVTFKDEKMCIVMKLYDKSLAQLLAHESLDLGSALNFIVHLFQALVELQEAGIVSRDIKPSNLLMDKYRNLVVADYGISLLMENNSTSCISAHNRYGTFNYMAPECFDPYCSIGYKSDVWSAACCAVEMLSGKQPFHHLQVSRLNNSTVSDPLESEISS